MIDSKFFCNYQIFLFYASLIFLFTSIIFFHLNKNKISLFLLFAGSLFLGFFMSSLDPYLNYWDEQIHALVAKNMAINPFKPMLYTNPVLPYNIELWDKNHIWLHKQPLFLWQIAISIKLFGTTAFAVRFPSVIMHSIMIIFIYRIGSLTLSKKTGFYASFLFCFSYYILELIVGGKTCDHNDIAFLFYISASFWAWFEYTNNPSWKWVIFIGIFSGCAILVKWLSGLLVFGGWGISLFFNKEGFFKLKNYFHILVSFLISMIMFTPWQIYISKMFPEESQHELSYNSRHITEVIEGHSGDWTFHFQKLYELYGQGTLVPFFIVLGLLFIFIRLKNLKHKILIFSSIFFSYGIYTFAATKMTSFGLIVSVFVILSFGILFTEFENLLQKKFHKYITQIIISFLLFISGILFLNIDDIERNHSTKYDDKSWYRNYRLNELKFIDCLSNLEPDTSATLFNVQENSSASIMFFKNYHAVYDFIPTEQQCNELLNKNILFVVFKNQWQTIPNYIYEKKIKVIPHIF